MVIGYYISMVAISLVCSAVYFWKWQKHFDIHFTLCYVLLPFVTMGYLLLATSEGLGSAMMANKINYLGGCYLELLITLIIFSLCKIKIPRLVSFLMVTWSTLIYAGALSIGYSDIFYKSAQFSKSNGVSVLIKEYGPMHAVFYPTLFFYFAISLGALIYSYRKKPEASIKNIILLSLTELMSIFCFFFGKGIVSAVDWSPFTYVFNAIIYLVIIDRISLYDIDDTVINSLIKQGQSGYISLDFKHNYLGSNESAKEYLPALRTARANMHFRDEWLREKTEEWIADFAADEMSRDLYFQRNMRIYHVTVNYLFDGKRKRGYLIIMTDDTRHQQYLKTIEQYNKNLKEELAAKTALLDELQSAQNTAGQDTPPMDASI